MLPLAISLSQSQIRLLSTIGMGVLVGTSLIVIIPEGIDTLYSVQTVHTTVAPAPPAAVIAPVPHDAEAPSFLLPRNEVEIDFPDDGDHHDEGSDHHDEDGHDHDEESSPHSYIGLALISGFILMYLVDVLPSSSNSAPANHQINLSSLGSLSSDSAPPAHSTASLTLGLLIHSFADGIALGASATTNSLSLGFIIFLAITLHKAPAAFGFTAVLLRTGLSKRTVRGHLAAFSLAAPVGAVCTYAVVSVLGSGDGQGMVWWTGMVLLFSGGTFLYVAMHAMKDVGAERQGRGDVLAAVGGMCLPLLTQLGGHHHH